MKRRPTYIFLKASGIVKRIRGLDAEEQYDDYDLLRQAGHCEMHFHHRPGTFPDGRLIFFSIVVMKCTMAYAETHDEAIQLFRWWDHLDCRLIKSMREQP